MRAGSLFAGLGGIDLAFQSAGIEILWYSELEKNCLKLLAQRFPKATSRGDITKFKPDPIQDAVDIIFGGSPCQDLSVAGQRSGLDGERSGLFYQMVRICKRLRPRYVVWENVPGAYSSNGGRDFACVIRAFTGLKVEVLFEGWGNAGFVRTPYPACRWHVAWRTLDAQHFGVPQRRRRIVLVASFGDASCTEILFEPESVRGDSAPSRETRERTAGSLSARTEGGGGLGTDFEIGGGLSKSLKGNTGGIDREDMHTLITATNSGRGYWNESEKSSPLTTEARATYETTLVAHTLSTEGADASEDGTGRGVPMVVAHGQANAEAVSDGEPSLSCNHEAPILFSHKDYGNGAAEGLSPTLRALNHKNGNSNDGSSMAIAFQPGNLTRRAGAEPSEEVFPTRGSETQGDQAPHSMVGTCVRRLTPTECERLQGLPDGWTQGFSDSTRYRMIGNSVAVPVFEWVARRILKFAKPAAHR